VAYGFFLQRLAQRHTDALQSERSALLAMFEPLVRDLRSVISSDFAIGVQREGRSWVWRLADDSGSLCPVGKLAKLSEENANGLIAWVGQSALADADIEPTACPVDRGHALRLKLDDGKAVWLCDAHGVRVPVGSLSEAIERPPPDQPTNPN